MSVLDGSIASRCRGRCAACNTCGSFASLWVGASRVCDGFTPFAVCGATRPDGSGTCMPRPPTRARRAKRSKRSSSSANAAPLAARRADGPGRAGAERRCRLVGSFDPRLGSGAGIQPGRGDRSSAGALAPVAGASDCSRSVVTPSTRPGCRRSSGGSTCSMPSPPSVRSPGTCCWSTTSSPPARRPMSAPVRSGWPAPERSRSSPSPGPSNVFCRFPPSMRGSRIGPGSTRVCGCG